MSPWNEDSRNEKRAHFSVVDVETTGLFPERNDRIIEIAIIHLGRSGEILDNYTTLVNPNRDLGPTHIHHISGAEIRGAPPFVEVAGDVLSRLAGTIFAGYYPHFDFRFLKCEVSRFGHKVPAVGLLCVDELARDVDPDLPGRKLEVCCKHFGIPLSNSHSAYADAMATANVLRECFRRTKLSVPTLLGHLDTRPFPKASDIWPGLKAGGRSYTRARAALAVEAEPNYIAKLVASLPSTTRTGQSLNRYYALLDRVLEDRVVTADETTCLLYLAQEIGISQSQARNAHCTYMRDLVLAALADGVITQAEGKDLRRVAKLLSISKSTFEDIVAEARASNGSRLSPPAPKALARRNLIGLSTCFTGELTCNIKGHVATRDLAEAIAQEKGMTVRKSVTKDLDILVAADPNSMSGKARKARQYNIRIVAEPVFWHWMGVDIG